MDKKKLIEAKKLLQYKLKLIENTLNKMEQNRMEELAGISEDDGYYTPGAADEQVYDDILNKIPASHKQAAIKIMDNDREFDSFWKNALASQEDADAEAAASYIKSKLGIEESQEERGYTSSGTIKTPAQALPVQKYSEKGERTVNDLLKVGSFINMALGSDKPINSLDHLLNMVQKYIDNRAAGKPGSITAKVKNYPDAVEYIKNKYEASPKSKGSSSGKPTLIKKQK